MKKGFTLVEVLGVIIVLGVISLMIVPRINNHINNSRLESFYAQVEMYKSNAKTYSIENPNLWPSEDGESFVIRFNTIKSEFGNSKLISPINGDECDGYFMVTRISSEEFNYIPHIKCFDGITNEISDNLVAHYTFDNNLFDNSLSNNEGLLSGSPVYENGMITFNDSSDMATFADISSISSQNYTYMFWLKHNSEPLGSWRNIVLKSPRNPGVWLYPGDNRVHFSPRHVNDTNYSANSTSELEEDVIYHVTIQSDWDGSNTVLKTFINGVLEAERNVAFEPVSTEESLIIGRREISFADLKIYDRILSEDEINFIYTVEKRNYNN